jgi:hypothetical protein
MMFGLVSIVSGAVMMSLSLLVVFSLLLTLVDRWLHSPCGWSCGYTLQDSAQQNLGLFSRLCLCKAQSNESNVLQHSNVKEK